MFHITEEAIRYAWSVNFGLTAIAVVAFLLALVVKHKSKK